MAGEKAFAKSKKIRQELEKKYCETNAETGIVLREENGEPKFKSPEAKVEFDKELEDKFNTEMVEIKVNKLDFKSLISVRGIQPSMWTELEPVLENVPEEV